MDNEQTFIFEGLLLKRFEDKLVVVSDETDRRKASNETFRNKGELSKAGFKWNSYLNAWVIHQSNLAHAQRVLQSINKKPLEKFIDAVEELPEFVRNVDNLSKKEELAGKIETFVGELSTAVDEAAASVAVRKYLEFNAKFRQYSWYNTLLIYLQRPDATQVAGFRQWQEKHYRRVKAGAKGISILAPISEKKPGATSTTSTTPSGGTSAAGNPPSPDPEPEAGDAKLDVEKEKTNRRFIAVSVFDISDTEAIDARGEVPSEPKWHGSNEPNAMADELFEAAKEVAEGMGIKITHDAAKGGEQGWTSGEHINITSTVAGVNRAATVIHEIAHDLLHFKRTSPFYIGDEEETTPGAPDTGKPKMVLTKQMKELQAESVSYVVIRYYGLPAEHQATYVALWRGNKEAVQKNLEVIKKAAYFIIDEIDKVQEEKQKQTAPANESTPLFSHLGGNRFKLNQ